MANIQLGITQQGRETFLTVLPSLDKSEDITLIVGSEVYRFEKIQIRRPGGVLMDLAELEAARDRVTVLETLLNNVCVIAAQIARSGEAVKNLPELGAAAAAGLASLMNFKKQGPEFQ